MALRLFDRYDRDCVNWLEYWVVAPADYVSDPAVLDKPTARYTVDVYSKGDYRYVSSVYVAADLPDSDSKYPWDEVEECTTVLEVYDCIMRRRTGVSTIRLASGRVETAGQLALLGDLSGTCMMLNNNISRYWAQDQMALPLFRCWLNDTCYSLEQLHPDQLDYTPHVVPKMPVECKAYIAFDVHGAYRVHWDTDGVRITVTGRATLKDMPLDYILRWSELSGTRPLLTGSGKSTVVVDHPTALDRFRLGPQGPAVYHENMVEHVVHSDEGTTRLLTWTVDSA